MSNKSSGNVRHSSVWPFAECVSSVPGVRVRVVRASSVQARKVVGLSATVMPWPPTSPFLEERHLLPVCIDGESHVMWVADHDVEEVGSAL